MKMSFDTFRNPWLTGVHWCNDHRHSYGTAADQVVCNVNRWAELREVAEKKKEGLQLAHDVNTFHIECQETAVWPAVFLSQS